MYRLFQLPSRLFRTVWNFAFVLQNDNAGGADPSNFSQGAGCEAGFFQAFATVPPNNIFALELDQQSDLVNDNGAGYGVRSPTARCRRILRASHPAIPTTAVRITPTSKRSAPRPSPLNSPASARGATTGDTYSVTLNYNGTDLVMNMYDVTAGGSCPGPSCFTQTWSDVNIPALVGSNTAYMGFTGGLTSFKLSALH